ncbi:unknown [Singapore grouper iridovirus]|uniref:Uncharacterized protein n=1 Tax=Singapore grouper iridovirus TaxID=262968 RepID=Q5YFB8_9VIRU|nr:hypothetical protein ORF147L [Singapore grouper iridovirus]AAS18162.1 unknown [Singapore grouper iridovirus]WAU86856.1 hypothetical protein ORF147L [Singapore grouper iridovirus]
MENTTWLAQSMASYVNGGVVHIKKCPKFDAAVRNFVFPRFKNPLIITKRPKWWLDFAKAITYAQAEELERAPECDLLWLDEMSVEDLTEEFAEKFTSRSDRCTWLHAADFYAVELFSTPMQVLMTMTAGAYVPCLSVGYASHVVTYDPTPAEMFTRVAAAAFSDEVLNFYGEAARLHPDITFAQLSVRADESPVMRTVMNAKSITDLQNGEYAQNLSVRQIVKMCKDYDFDHEALTTKSSLIVAVKQYYDSHKDCAIAVASQFHRDYIKNLLPTCNVMTVSKFSRNRIPKNILVPIECALTEILTRLSETENIVIFRERDDSFNEMRANDMYDLNFIKIASWLR